MFVGQADDGGHRHCRVPEREILQVDGADPFAAGFDDVLRAVDDPHVTVGVERGDIAGGKPAAGAQNFRAVAKIRAADPVAAHLQLSEGVAIARQFVILVVGDAQLDAGENPALRGVHRGPRLGRQRFMLPQKRVHRAGGAGLRHAPAVANLEALLALERVDQRGRRRCAADDGAVRQRQLDFLVAQMGERREPDRRHAGRDRHAFVRIERAQARAVEAGAGQDHLGANHRGGVGQAPGVDMKHRHDGQRRVARGEPHRIGQIDRVGVEPRRAVGVEHALGVTRRARRVAERRGRLLAEFRPLVVVALGGDEFLVAVQRCGVRRLMRAVRERHPVLHAGAERPELGRQRRERQIETDH